MKLCLTFCTRGGHRGYGRWRARRLVGAFAAIAFVAAPSIPASASEIDVIVSPHELQQRIDGFGASSAWSTPDMSDSDVNLAFSTDGGVGLSLLRIRIQPCSGPAPGTPCQLTSLEVSTAQKAQALGVGVWATPWSPPPAWKSNDNLDNGGTLLPGNADDWANALVGFVQYMQSNGVTLVGLSAQNEPDFPAAGMSLNYDSCQYTSSSLADLIGNHLGPAFQDAGLLGASGGLPFRIIGPETYSPATDFESYSDAISDSGAAAYVGTIATHSYGALPSAHPEIAGAGKEYWETEVYDETDPADSGIASGLWVAQTMSAALVQAGVNAWHYWWLYNQAPNNEGLWDMDMQPTKRLYAMGNYSRFVRPGFHLVTATPYPADNVYVSAFYDTASSQVVVVSINAGASAVPLTFLFDSASTGSWTSWVTSATQNLEPGDAIPSDAGPVVYTLQPESITTLHGSVTGPGPPIVLDAGAASDASAGVNDEPDGAEGCGLACWAAGRAPKSGGPRQKAVVLSLVAGAFMRRRRLRIERARAAQ